jgi:hypothetical protein
VNGDAGAQPPVARITALANPAIAANHGNAHTGAGAQNSNAHGRIQGGGYFFSAAFCACT